MHINLFRDKKRASSGGCVLGLELVLGIPVQQAGLANTCVAHDHNLRVDAGVIVGP